MNTLVIVIHEIYGINDHITSYCQHLRKHGFDVIAPNLLKEQSSFSYEEEEFAYDRFVSEVGFIIAADKLKKLIYEKRDHYKMIYLVGFSIGATIAWLCSEEKGISGVVGYYGSRIRDYTEMKPACPILLFFPENERTFHVDELMTKLIEKKVEVRKYEGEHGFGDPYSKRYNRASAEDSFYRVINFISGHFN